MKTRNRPTPAARARDYKRKKFRTVPTPALINYQERMARGGFSYLIDGAYMRNTHHSL